VALNFRSNSMFKQSGRFVYKGRVTKPRLPSSNLVSAQKKIYLNHSDLQQSDLKSKLNARARKTFNGMSTPTYHLNNKLMRTPPSIFFPDTAVGHTQGKSGRCDLAVDGSGWRTEVQIDSIVSTARCKSLVALTMLPETSKLDLFQKTSELFPNTRNCHAQILRTISALRIVIVQCVRTHSNGQV
jgi:hypothetical protein